MNTSNGNGLNHASKAGIITWALLSARKIVILLIAFGLGLETFNWFIAFSHSTNKFFSGSALIFGIEKIIYAFFMFSICFRRDGYTDLVMHFESNAKIHLNHPSLEAYIKRNRYIFHLFTFVNFLILFSLAIVPLIVKLIESNISTLDVLIFGSWHIGFCSLFALLRFFVEACLYIHTCFIRVENQIDTLNNSSNALSIDDIRKVRRLYCFAVETTEKFNSLLWPVISTYFVVSIVNSHFAFARAITEPSFALTMICFGEFSVFFLIAYNMIYINHLATRIYQSVYSLTYKTDSLFAKKEVQLFLTRIERADVGFTFLDLFVITPTCVTSLATISLTLGLAEPTLIK
uniref:Gustatory receptor n=1 Tax=Tetranychus urticae TaxID=32264 RepID=T1KAK9_TETUR